MSKTQTPPSPPATPPRRHRARRAERPGQLYRLSLDQYWKMIEAGILESGAPIELLDGLLVRKMTKGCPHTTAVKLVVRELSRAIPDGFHAGQESPLTLPGAGGAPPSVPEPDFTIVRGDIRDYLKRDPLPADVALVVEVAASSLRKDREGLARYARDGVPVAWILNLGARVLEVYTTPSGPGPDPRYADSRTFGADDSAPLVLGGEEVSTIPVARLLP